MDWILNNFWLVPAIPFASFWLILFFGKRLPGKGAEVGVGLAIVLLIYRNRVAVNLDEIDLMKG